MTDETSRGPNGLTVAAIRVRQSRPETARYDVGVLLAALDMAEQRCRELTKAAVEAHAYLPYGGTRDYLGDVLGLAVQADEDE